MIITKLQGGLGNQMFQYAIGVVLADKNNVELQFDQLYFLQKEKKPGFTPRHFELAIFNPPCKNTDEQTVNKFFTKTKMARLKKYLRLSYRKVYREEICRFESSILTIKAPVYLDGYFQSEKYYIGNESRVRNLFQFPLQSLSKELNEIIERMENSNAVAVHFRRGDYVADAITGSFHGSCSLDYYRSAFEVINASVSNPHFFIFSDDIGWVEQQISSWESTITFVKGFSNNNAWVDMMLMSKCKHNIIANSSFSWWGAWLNAYPQKMVIAPEKWFNDSSIDPTDLVPESWIRI